MFFNMCPVLLCFIICCTSNLAVIIRIVKIFIIIVLEEIDRRSCGSGFVESIIN
ncbi:hypothetical protein NT07LI_0660 [Listeria innocua FSL S4-378]|nr:hypothetical protein NT07LI_0660 [Listeria innocua FSL S4-378]